MITVESALADLLDTRDRVEELVEVMRMALKNQDMRSLHSVAARLDHIVSDIDSEWAED